MYVCPYCGCQWSDDEEHYTCSECGETDTEHFLNCRLCSQDFECEDGSLPICDNCLTETYKSLDCAISLADYEAKCNDTEPVVNDFFVWLLGKEGIHKILYEYCSEHTSSEDIMNFFSAGDPCTLEDWLKERYEL